MSKAFKWTLIIFLVIFVAQGILMPYLNSKKPTGGSYEAARQWSQLLSTCDSPNDVRKLFICDTWRLDPNGVQIHEAAPSIPDQEDPSAWIYEFDNEDWLAIAYADSYSGSAGGTIVSLDSNGTTKVFFGLVRGNPLTSGKSLEEVYSSYDPNWKEIDLE